MVKEFDEVVEVFWICLFDVGLYIFFVVDVLVFKVCEVGCVVGVYILIVIGVNVEGY